MCMCMYIYIYSFFRLGAMLGRPRTETQCGEECLEMKDTYRLDVRSAEQLF